jgi:hypothetical protein
VLKNKIREMGEPLTLDGCDEMERHSNKPKVGGSNGLEVNATVSWAMKVGWDLILLFGPLK